MSSTSKGPDATSGENDWYLLVRGRQEGPLPKTAVIEKIQKKQVERKTYIWCEGMSDWQRLGRIATFTPYWDTSFAQKTVAMSADEISKIVPEDDRPMGTAVFKNSQTRVADPSVMNTLARASAHKTVIAQDLPPVVLPKPEVKPIPHADDSTFGAITMSGIRRRQRTNKVALWFGVTLSVTMAVTLIVVGARTIRLASSVSSVSSESSKPRAVFPADPQTDSKTSDGRVTPPQGTPASRGFTKDMFVKVVERESPLLRSCIEDAQRVKETIPDRLDVELLIEPNGSIREVHVLSPIYARSRLAGCLIKQMREWQFPRFEGEPVTVLYPYVFDSGRH